MHVSDASLFWSALLVVCLVTTNPAGAADTVSLREAGGTMTGAAQ